MSLIKTYTSDYMRYSPQNDTDPTKNKDNMLATYATNGTANTSGFWFSKSDMADMRAIINDENITIDKVEIYLHGNSPQIYAGSLKLGSTHVNRSSGQLTPSAPNIYVTIAISRPFPGGWFEITQAMLQDAVSNNNYGYAIAGASSGVQYYASFDFPQLRITYHYHNSVPTFSSSQCEFGSAVTLNLTTYLASYTHKIRFSVGSDYSEINLSAGNTSYSFTPPLAWVAQLPNTTQGVLNAQLTTYNGSDVVGDQPTATIAINVPSSVLPSPGSISYTVDNALNVPISNRSLVMSLSGQAGIYGSTVRSYILQAEGYSSTNEALEIPSVLRIPSNLQQRSLAVTATVTDSRGRSASTTLNITVYEWDVPYFDAIEYYRCNSYGTKSEDGGYLSITCTYTCFPVTVGGTNKNSITAHTYKIVTKDGRTIIAQGTLSGSVQVVGGGNLSTDEEYYLQLTLTDGVTTIVYQYLIYSSNYVIHFRNGGTGVAFGMAADANNTVKINPNWVLIIGNNIDVAAKLADLESRIAALE